MKTKALLLMALCATLAACQSKPIVADGSAVPSAMTSSDVQRCEALPGTVLGTSTIEKAELVRRGDSLMGFWRRLIIKTLVFPGLPEMRAAADFCKVTAKLRPVVGSEITAQLWLPQSAHWNGKFLGTGGGGINGGLVAAALTLRKPLEKGYVGMATDAGHEVTDTAEFAHKSKEQYVDYAYRANHVAADFAKALIATYYGTPAKRSYFHGCSNGGRDALMEARRYPDDYEAIIAGAPAAGWSKLMASSGWITQASVSAPKLGRKMKLVQDAVIAKCDALDGVTDGLLENPNNCPFDPAALQCSGEDRADCLNSDEVSALQKIYTGPRLKDGTQVYPGVSPGGEALPHNWSLWVTGGLKSMLAKLGIDSMRWMIYGDADWGLKEFDVDSTYALAKERVAPIMDSDDPDLSGFMRRGGKLILYQGWNDPAITAGATIAYHAAVRETLGSAADSQVRLFMAPGMAHCGGGTGPNDFDMLDEMDRWVENGVAPERIVATEYDPPALLGPAPDAKVVRTRPLCTWPKVAHYNGSGSTDDASNFSCR